MGYRSTPYPSATNASSRTRSWMARASTSPSLPNSRALPVPPVRMSSSTSYLSSKRRSSVSQSPVSYRLVVVASLSLPSPVAASGTQASSPTRTTTASADFTRYVDTIFEAFIASATALSRQVGVLRTDSVAKRWRDCIESRAAKSAEGVFNVGGEDGI